MPTPQQLADLRLLGCDVGCLSITAYHIAHIMGIHFRCNEWDTSAKRCGSVITCVVGGRSLYARVHAFVSVYDNNEPGYALVGWFGEPEYPLRGTPLVVRVSEDGTDLDASIGCAIKITSIDPSRVTVECTTNDLYYMMRDSGYDTIL